MTWADMFQNKSLKRQLREMDDRFSATSAAHRDSARRLQEESNDLKEERGRHLREYQDLLALALWRSPPTGSCWMGRRAGSIPPFRIALPFHSSCNMHFREGQRPCEEEHPGAHCGPQRWGGHQGLNHCALKILSVPS
ncbi:vimentin-1/2-like [Phycodurus eques]|uniref:vimentin-1/2-like n=1 Tax=Phycodurus eques TaxID=693459 RepID=UPI002ACE9338|nr:vimentin-1/2-like [Phycodurus eques]